MTCPAGFDRGLGIGLAVGAVLLLAAALFAWELWWELRRLKAMDPDSEFTLSLWRDKA